MGSYLWYALRVRTQASDSADADAVREAEDKLAKTTVRRDVSTDKYSESSSYYMQAHSVEETILTQPQVGDGAFSVGGEISFDLQCGGHLV